jgi:hypothetical protein
MANITPIHGSKLYILALVGYTPQEMANKYPDYNPTQIRNYLNRKYPELKGKITKDTSRGNSKMKSLLDEIFNHDKVEVEFPIGKSLRLDCYVGQPYNLGFEFDGIQHNRSIDHFGGDEAYIKGVQNDQLKDELCKGRGINLIRFNHDEELTVELIKERIEQTGYGTGHVKEGFETKQEKKKEKDDRLKKRAKDKRKQQYEKNKQRMKSSEQYQRNKEYQRARRKEQYQKAKAWKANRRNKP